ncbi:MAG: hypothetical protein PHO74_01830 [Weeksellaceae bacterium]|nr:hypothetical protein [Weeksellaceae bacterium]
MKIRKQTTVIILSFFLSGMARGQFFEEEQTQAQNSPFSENDGYFSDTGPDYSTSPTATGSEPDYGEDVGPGNPGGKVPVNDWLFLLPMVGMAVGVYYLRRRSKEIC